MCRQENCNVQIKEKIARILGIGGCFKKEMGTNLYDSYLKVKVTQSYLTLFDPMDYTVHKFSRSEHWSG